MFVSTILEKNSGKSRKRAVRERKAFTLFISNEVMNDSTEMKKVLEESAVLIYAITETIKQKIKHRKVDFLVFC